ncbi:hypothetical protein GCM10029978_100740 [Actinoallomurus acanthiterrae]
MPFMTITLSVILGLLFVVTGMVKVVDLPESVKIRDHLGLPPELWRVIGSLEAAGGVGLLIGMAFPGLGAVAAIGLAALMCGAVISRLRVRDSVRMISVDAVVLALIGTLAFLITGG